MAINESGMPSGNALTYGPCAVRRGTRSAEKDQKDHGERAREYLRRRRSTNQKTRYFLQVSNSWTVGRGSKSSR
jgi:hypothetical protein